MNEQLSIGTDAFACDECRGQVPAPLWAVVDARERPDLIEELKTGRLNFYTCPHCRHAGICGIAVVFHRLFEHRPVIVSPAGDGMSEDAGGMAFFWIHQLGEKLGKPDDWVDRLVSEGLPIIPRARLAELLQAPDPDRQQRLLQALGSLIEAETYPAVAEVLEAHAELLSEEADRMLARTVESLEAESRPEDAEIFRRRLEFLRSARAVGIEQALIDKTGMSAPEREGAAKHIMPRDGSGER